MQQSKNIKSPQNPSQHTKNKHKTYQQGGPKDQNGYKNFNLSPAQAQCLKIIENNIITFVEGSAGSGKSLSALYYSVKEYLNTPTQKIIVIRTPMEATLHDKVGFLPDNLSCKLQPHFASTKLLLEQLLTPAKVQADIEGPHKRIEFLVPNFALGCTFDNAIIIVDEAQTIPPVIMKLLLERIGTNSKMIVLGDPSQIYSNDKNRQGLTDAISKFFIVDSSFKVEQPKFEDIGYFRFSIDDCMRSDIVKTVLKAYSSPEKISK
jgi:phosphate starvation-inducible PhoH-like protein